MQARDLPIVVPAKSPALGIQNSAAIIFMHGFNDEAGSFENIAHQFQAAAKLPYLEWIFPNATENHDAMARAWYTPTSLTPFPSSRPELNDPEDEEGMFQSIQYIESLIEGLLDRGIAIERIVVGGFSQGCAISLLMNLTSKYAGRLAGILGICGYLPLQDRIEKLRVEAGLTQAIGETPVFFARGTRDILVPRRYFSMCHQRLEDLGMRKDLFCGKEYEGMGHDMGGPLLRDACAWLEDVIPPLE